MWSSLPPEMPINGLCRAQQVSGGRFLITRAHDSLSVLGGKLLLSNTL